MAPPTARPGIVRRIAVGCALLVGLLAGVVVVQAIVQHRNPWQTAMNDLPIIPTPQSVFHRDRIALLMLGIDYNYDDKDIEFSTNARTDTIKTVALDFPSAAYPNGRIAILSVPRDTEVTLPDGTLNKINAAYTGFGSNTGAAARNSEKVVAGFLGLPGFDRYVTLRIDATKDLIDAIGGIDVVPDETMNYDDNWGHLHIHFIGGKKYHMNGDQAVSYSRFRHDACSDPCRIKRQDQVIRITMTKLKSDKFNDLLHINALIGVARRNVYTDMSDQEMLSLAWAFQHVDIAKLQTEQVPYTDDRELPQIGDVLIPDDAAKAALVRKIFFPQPAPPLDPTALAQVDPATIHVEVRNGSGVSGQGARLADVLRKKGYAIAGVGNADNFGYEATEIRVHSTAAPLVGESVRQALALKTAMLESDAPGTKPAAGDVTVIVGRDYATLAPQSDARTK